jgi:cell division protein FtsW (lipid II flippase)
MAILYIIVGLILVVSVTLCVFAEMPKSIILPLAIAVVALFIGLYFNSDYNKHKEEYSASIQEYEEMADEAKQDSKRFGSVEMADAYSSKQEEWKDEADYWRKSLRDDMIMEITSYILS